MPFFLYMGKKELLFKKYINNAFYFLNSEK
ncbi:hypothetical protein DFP80_113106 [Marinomonas rhizomae]|uniref:Uncharacterized protein n=1 Tax=Marinomonas rhizomae TaxID=491948 RepID=A0A366IZT4_9GAMM|nr:hypothetical protein DFP80_113106 [Marinomonas rhizomae]